MLALGSDDVNVLGPLACINLVDAVKEQNLAFFRFVAIFGQCQFQLFDNVLRQRLAVVDTRSARPNSSQFIGIILAFVFALRLNCLKQNNHQDQEYADLNHVNLLHLMRPLTNRISVYFDGVCLLYRG